MGVINLKAKPLFLMKFIQERLDESMPILEVSDLLLDLDVLYIKAIEDVHKLSLKQLTYADFSIATIIHLLHNGISLSEIAYLADCSYNTIMYRLCKNISKECANYHCDVMKARRKELQKIVDTYKYSINNCPYEIFSKSTVF